MPEGDRSCAIEVSVLLKPAITAMEIRLIRTDTNMQTARAHLGGIARLNKDDLDARLFCLVTDHRLQFGEAPIVHNFRFTAFSNPGELFEHDPLIGRFRSRDDLLASAVISVGNKSLLSAR